MQHKSGFRGIFVLFLAALLSILACSISTSTAPTAPAFDPTKFALEFQLTSVSMQMTQQAMIQQAIPQVQPTQPPPPTLPPLVQVAETLAPTEILPTPTEDVESQIKNAKVLIYENTDERGIGMWIQEAVSGMGIKFTQTGSYSGHFMEYLNSGTKWDLVIVGAEDKDKISGEFWDVINTRLTRDKVALIAEVWYLDREANGRIAKILSGCGIRYQKDYQLADSIYWWESDHEVFNVPNVVLPLLHYDRYWANQTGDQIRLGGGGTATLLAGLSARPSNQEAVLATCYDGRVIIQTFSDHDYDEADVIPLWQNYIHWTLKNHFLAVP